MSKLGNTPHIRLFTDKDGQLYILDQNTKQKKLISMRQNADGTKTSRALASEIEESIWDFRWDHKDTKKGDGPLEDEVSGGS
jgi:hypothetical protein